MPVDSEAVAKASVEHSHFGSPAAACGSFNMYENERNVLDPPDRPSAML